MVAVDDLDRLVNRRSRGASPSQALEITSRWWIQTEDAHLRTAFNEQRDHLPAQCTRTAGHQGRPRRGPHELRIVDLGELHTAVKLMIVTRRREPA